MLGTLFGTLTALVITAPYSEVSPPAYSPRASFTLPMAQDLDRPIPPIKRKTDSFGVKTSAQAVFVADVASGKVLYAKNQHRSMPIASLTKLVTAMVFLDAKPDLQKTLTFVAADFDGEAKAVFQPGETITYEDALKSLLVGSVNASAVALARATGSIDDFVIRMNQKMMELDLKSPELVEPSGVDPDNVANAADVAALITTAASYSEIRDYAKLAEIDVKIKNSKRIAKIKSTNLLLSTYLNKEPYKIVTAKTGSLPQAGYCMAQITTTGSGKEVVAVELGSDNHFSRYNDIKALTTWAFDAYEWR